MIINILLILATLTTFIIAIAGETWNSENKGFKKLTVLGRYAVIAGLIVAILSGIKEYENLLSSESSAASFKQEIDRLKLSLLKEKESKYLQGTKSLHFDVVLNSYSELIANSEDNTTKQERLFFEILEKFWDFGLFYKDILINENLQNIAHFLRTNQKFFLKNLNNPDIREKILASKNLASLYPSEGFPRKKMICISHSLGCGDYEHLRLSQNKAEIIWFSLLSIYSLWEFGLDELVLCDKLLEELVFYDKPLYFELKIYTSIPFRIGNPKEFKKIMNEDSLKHVMSRKIDLENVSFEEN